MSNKGFTYRLAQKIKYHFSSDSFTKKVAEENRNEEVITLNDTNFQVKGSDLSFSKKKHAFLIQNLSIFLKLNAAGEFSLSHDILIYKYEEVSIRILTSEELFIASEVFLKKEYNFQINKEEIIVVDIGMNVGMASLYFATKKNVSGIFSYELIPATYEAAKNNLDLNPELSKKIKSYPFGIGKSNTSKELNYSNDTKGQNSLYGNTGNAKVQVTIKDVSEVLNELAKHNLAMVVKVDCEGSEFEIFDRLKETGINEKVIAFMIEWHFQDPQPILSTLKENGFSLFQNQQGKVGIIHAFKSNIN